MRWLRKISQQLSLYHGSKQSFPIDFILQPQKTGYVYEELEIENIVEKYRPPSKISRFESVFMVDNPNLIDSAGGYEDNIYTVEPIGQVDKSDLSWYTELSIYDDFNENQQRELSLNYWNGIQYKNPANSLWEYRARQAKIIKIIE